VLATRPLSNAIEATALAALLLLVLLPTNEQRKGSWTVPVRSVLWGVCGLPTMLWCLPGVVTGLSSNSSDELSGPVFTWAVVWYILWALPKECRVGKMSARWVAAGVVTAVGVWVRFTFVGFAVAPLALALAQHCRHALTQKKLRASKSIAAVELCAPLPPAPPRPFPSPTPTHARH
jgi:hypothetical protein